MSAGTVVSQTACIPGLDYRWSFNEVQGTQFMNSAKKVPGSLVSGVNFYVPGTVPGDQCISGDVPAADGSCTQSNPEGTSAMGFNPNGAQMLDPLSYNRPAKMTATLWFKSSSSNEQALLSFYWTSYSIKLLLTANVGSSAAGKLKLTMDWNPTISAQATARSYNTGEWHFVAVTMDDASKANLYVYSLSEIQAGMLGSFGAKLTLSIASTIAHPTMFLQMGGFSSDTPANYKLFYGALDDIRLYNGILSIDNLKTIAMLQDFPCSAISLGVGTKSLQMQAGEVVTFLIDTTDSKICAPKLDGTCGNTRYGVVLSSCSGNFSGLNLNIEGQTATYANATGGFSSNCAATDQAVPLCPYARNTITVTGVAQPFTAGNLNQIIIASATDVDFEATVTVANSNSPPVYNPAALSFASVTGEAVCGNSSISASWQIPMLSDGNGCSDCQYQVWIVNASLQGHSFQTACELKKYGTAVGQYCTWRKLINFQLDNTVPSGSYKVVIYGKNDVDKVGGVVVAFDNCVLNHDAATVGNSINGYACACQSNSECSGTQQCANDHCSDSGGGTSNNTMIVGKVAMLVNGDYNATFAQRETRLAWQENFVQNVTKSIQTNRTRLRWDDSKGYTLGPDYVVTNIEILPPGFDDGTPKCCSDGSLDCKACLQDMSKQEYCVQYVDPLCSALKQQGEQCSADADECVLYYYCSASGICEGPRGPPPIYPDDTRSVEELTNALEAQVETPSSALHQMQPALSSSYFVANPPVKKPPQPQPQSAEPEGYKLLLEPWKIGVITAGGVVLCCLCSLLAYKLLKKKSVDDSPRSKEPLKKESRSKETPKKDAKEKTISPASPAKGSIAKSAAAPSSAKPSANTSSVRQAATSARAPSSARAAALGAGSLSPMARTPAKNTPPPLPASSSQSPQDPPNNYNSINNQRTSSDIQTLDEPDDHEGDEELQDGEQQIAESIDPPRYGKVNQTYDKTGKTFQKGDLACKQSEEIKLLEQHGQDWFLVENKNGEQGLFPANHIEGHSINADQQDLGSRQPRTNWD